AKTGHIIAQTTEECKHFFQLFSRPRTTHSKTNTLRHPHPTPPKADTPKPAQNWATTKNTKNTKKGTQEKRKARKGTRKSCVKARKI
ncbi:MAG: hypothetical protein ACI4QJ_02095, partial [Candidatus Spyradenecus sp.]